MFKPVNPDYDARIRTIFADAAFIADLGVELAEFGPGWCETRLAIAPRHLQQDGVIHAGVQATMADHTAGAAAGTLMAADQIVLTVEFKIHLLRAARGDRLRCRAEVLRPGRTVTAVESSVFAGDTLVAKLTATMALVSAP
ncbi:MAG: PaaI family thioesterase [Nannocystaceae bacterium]